VVISTMGVGMGNEAESQIGGAGPGESDLKSPCSPDGLHESGATKSEALELSDLIAGKVAEFEAAGLCQFPTEGLARKERG
jgi:hypothetical protein